ncbi:hypothetical protein Dsin_019264 [Dipteronia sinensis]|uniref:DUF4283 domain-containing protein n=1 Tax=Dipteronia sinensis TaxID=43782 RepID=A0AAE0A892_9ROSI|nr:hypothetical protein Dsin_019264 [Dipteronia sinensis]
MEQSRVGRFYGQQSYAEAVKGSAYGGFDEKGNNEEKCKEVKLSLNWNVQLKDSFWLQKCSFGILKSFSNVSALNAKLESKGWYFSSLYYGDKCILWSFELEQVKEDFIKSYFLWDDIFLSMMRWLDAIVPKSRPVWLNFLGTPLNCWNEAFFKKICWLVREPLMIDEEMSNRVRLDRGRILVLFSKDKQCLFNIKVNGGIQSFTCVVPNMERNWMIVRKMAGDLSSLPFSQDESDRMGVNGHVSEKERREVGGIGDLRKHKTGKKGKSKWVRISKVKPSLSPSVSGKLILEKAITGVARWKVMKKSGPARTRAIVSC